MDIKQGMKIAKRVKGLILKGRWFYEKKNCV